ncbi:MAG: xylulokinase [Anaerolineaceae bacterium]|nr:xylulokinase [Anaerolineaceae bacterium]
MSEHFIGLDVSTTASKAVAIDASGAVVATASHDHQLDTPRPLWSEQDPAEWWRASCASLRQVARDVPQGSIAALGLTGQMHGLTALDARDEPLRPAILWNDQRSAVECEAITEAIGAERLYRLIGSRIFPGFTAPKVAWLREHEPEIYQRIAQVLLPKDYVRFLLSGERVTDVADGSGMALMDIGARDWSAEMLDALAIPRDWLPTLAESQEVCAEVSPGGAAATGLPVGTRIVGGAGDQPAGGVGSGVVSAGQLSLAMGTSGVAYAINDRYEPEPQGRLHTFCGPIPGTWFSMGVMLSAAGGLRWLRDALAPDREFDELGALAEAVPPGAEGLLFAPWLSGERHPHPDPLARGAFVGLTLRHGLGHMVRAVMEGVAFGIRESLELLQAQELDPSDAVIQGGAANSPLWRQLTTDIMDLPLYRVNTSEGAAFGAAILAAVGAGAYPDVPAACGAMVQRLDESLPQPELVARYRDIYPVYRRLYPSLAPLFHKLAQLDA